MLPEFTNTLIATARNRLATEENINSAAQSFFMAAAKAPRDQTTAALRSLVRHYDLEDPQRAAFLCFCSGVLVERGADPSIIAEPLMARLGPLLESAGALVTACESRMPAVDDPDQDPSESFSKVFDEVASQMPAQNAAWLALDQFWNPAITVYSVNKSARQAAHPLMALAKVISQYHPVGHWLCLMLSVLDDEPILVIEPETSTGIVGRMSGIVDNFQLNTLLMDTFPNQNSGQRVSKAIVETARGKGPQEGKETVTSVWNLYNWKAVQPSLRLPDAADTSASDVWIWNEGVPADIPVFEGHRVILLGPHTYPRSWPSQRMFQKLPATVETDRVLSSDEVSQWLGRMLAAKTST